MPAAKRAAHQQDAARTVHGAGSAGSPEAFSEAIAWKMNGLPATISICVRNVGRLRTRLIGDDHDSAAARSDAGSVLYVEYMSSMTCSALFESTPANVHR